MTENNTGITWTFEDISYFLRDDEASGICDHERYSLFRLTPARAGRHVLCSRPSYGRVSIWRGPLRRRSRSFIKKCGMIASITATTTLTQQLCS